MANAQSGVEAKQGHHDKKTKTGFTPVKRRFHCNKT
jgi:hypothetical protein